MKQLDYLDAARDYLDKLSGSGVFLNLSGARANTMTIGWASIGYLWKKPVLTVLVRPQRFSYDLIQSAGEFSVSVPTREALKRELAFAGSKSGRDLDKFDGHGLTAAKAQIVGAPIVAECGLHFECRTLLVQDITGERMADALKRSAYPKADYHTMFFGEILSCYSTDE